MTDPTRVLCATTISWRSVGGLEAIVRNLATRSASPHVWATREHLSTGEDDFAGVPSVLLERRRGGERCLRIAGRLGRRAPALAVRAFGWALRPALERAAPTADALFWAGNGRELLGFELLRLARRRDAPLVVLPAIHPGTWGDEPLDGKLYRAADRMLALSRHEQQLLERLGVPPARVVALRPGPTVELGGDGARLRHRHGIPDDEFLVGFVGRRTTAKGLDLLVEAVQVAEGPQRLRLVVAGPTGDSQARLPGDAVDLGVASAVDLTDLFAAVDVLCLPSAAEAFGLVYLDAWSYGKPVIAGTAPAARELVRDGVDGLHVDSDPRTLAAALESLASDPRRAVAMGEAGRQRQLQEFTWSGATATYDAALRTATDERAARTGQALRWRREVRPS